MLVEQILKNKGHEVVTIKDDLSLTEAAELLHQRGIGAIIVLDQAGGVCGILSERDIIRAIAETGQKALLRPARSFMTRLVHTCGPEDCADTLFKVMTDRRVRHLPVIEGSELVGIISIGDIVKAHVSEVEHEHACMAEYIGGGR